MVTATKKTLESYRAKIKFGQQKTLPMGQGMAIKTLIKEYQIPAIAWGYSGSLIGLETKKQILIWRDKGTTLEFKGLINKSDGSVDTHKNVRSQMQKITRERYEYILNVLPPLTMGVKETTDFLRKYDDVKLAKLLEYNDVVGAFMQGEGIDNHDVYMVTKKGDYFLVGKTINDYNTEMFRYNNWRTMSKKEFDRYNMR